MVTGGVYSAATEILKDDKWTILKNGNLPTMINGLGLATIDNQVFSFGKIIIFSMTYDICLIMKFKEVDR